MNPFKPNVKSMKDKKDFDGLADVLRSGSFALRQEAVKALEEIGSDDSCEPLASALQDKNKAVRKAAAVALGTLASKEAAAYLVGAMDDEEWNVRDAAVLALGRTGNSEVVIMPLIRALSNLDWYSVDSVAEALGCLGDVRAVKPLVELLERNYINDVLLDSLGKIGEAAVDPLVEVMHRGNKHTRSAAASALERIGTASVAQLIELSRDDTMRKSVSEALCGIGDSAVEPLVIALTDADVNIRKTALEVLDKIGYAASCEHIIPLLSDDNVAVRIKALEILDRINDDSIEYLINTLQDISPFVREKAAKVLGNKKSPKALEALTHALGDEYEFIRKESEQAINKIKNKGDVTKKVKNPRNNNAKFMLLLLLSGLLIAYAAYTNYVRIFLK